MPWTGLIQKKDHRGCKRLIAAPEWPFDHLTMDNGHTSLWATAHVDGLDDAVEGTDALTGFGNHAKLVSDLTEALACEDDPSVLAVFSLVGSEEHRKAFGERANDELLARLASRFEHALGTGVNCYRARCDEFSALIPASADEAAPLLSAAEKELAKAGRSLSVGVAFGLAFLPEEADDPIELLILADTSIRSRGASDAPRERRKRARVFSHS